MVLWKRSKTENTKLERIKGMAEQSDSMQEVSQDVLMWNKGEKDREAEMQEEEDEKGTPWAATTITRAM